jgi:hypothetical protein
MHDVSEYITKHTESADEFERGLYEELVRRIRVLRKEGRQIEPYRWQSWVLPVITVAVIVVVFYAYVFAAT